MRDMAKSVYRFKTKLWKYQGDAAWYFVSLPKKESLDIKAMQKGARRGFGSIRVTVTIGKTTWQTSIFPTKQGPYLLPIKASVRKAGDLFEDDMVAYSVRF
jgi:hypothetical protein